MRLQEIMGIESNRRWGVCSLNDFRKVFHFLFISVTYDIKLRRSSFASNVGVKHFDLPRA